MKQVLGTADKICRVHSPDAAEQHSGLMIHCLLEEARKKIHVGMLLVANRTNQHYVNQVLV